MPPKPGARAHLRLNWREAEPAWPPIIEPRDEADPKRSFCSKLQIALEEADETQFWLGLAAEGELPARRDSLQALVKEADELTAILVASLKTARRNKVSSALPTFCLLSSKFLVS